MCAPKGNFRRALPYAVLISYLLVNQLFTCDSVSGEIPSIFLTAIYCCNKNTLKKSWDSFNLSALKECIFNFFFYLENFIGVTLATAAMYIFHWDFVSLTFYSNVMLTEQKNVSTWFIELTFNLSHKYVSQRNLSL